MKSLSCNTLISTITVSIIFASGLSSNELAIDVEVLEQNDAVNERSILPDTPSLAPVTDAGELLKSESGVSAARKGGKGFEPVIRGQQQSQLNILLGGAAVYGACPGRMDPPTTYATMAGYDEVRILHGYESVTYGSGGSGGTVLFERKEPDFNPSKPIAGRLSGSYSDNSQDKKLSADIAAGEPDTYLRAYGQIEQSGNYKDGEGNKVSSAFKSNSGGLLFSTEIALETRIEANVEFTRDDDIYYSGNGMDAPWAKADIWRLSLKRDEEIFGVDAFEISFYRSDVQHLMDNYSVRLRKPDKPMGIFAPSDSMTTGGRLSGSLYLDRSTLVLGADFLINNRDAKRYDIDRTTGEKIWQSYMWPDVRYQQVGLFSELDYEVNKKHKLRFGLRLDDLTAEARKASNNQLEDSSPDALYQKYYGVDADKTHERHLSGLLTWQHLILSNQKLEYRLSRTVRSADASERFMASKGSCCHGSSDWVGNPEIKPEQHHQADAGYQLSGNNYEWSSVVYIDEVSDYILRAKTDSGAFVYKNIHARLYGIDTELKYSLGAFKPSISLSWIEGSDQTNHRALPQIPPLTMDLKLGYENEKWLVGAHWVLAAPQTRVNEQSGLDSGESAGYGVVHLNGSYQLYQNLTLQGGVKNLFNKTYSPHINRASRDPFNPDTHRINEPGREFWLRLSYPL